MVDVVVYVSSVANPRKHSRKIQCLESFAQGVQAVGDTALVEWDYRYTPSRLAVMLGWATTNTGGRNIALRKQIIAEQRRHGFQTMCIDASCFKYLDDHGSYFDTVSMDHSTTKLSMPIVVRRLASGKRLVRN